MQLCRKVLHLCLRVLREVKMFKERSEIPGKVGGELITARQIHQITFGPETSEALQIGVYLVSISLFLLSIASLGT